MSEAVWFEVVLFMPRTLCYKVGAYEDGSEAVLRRHSTTS
jgi:hypothetical protein